MAASAGRLFVSGGNYAKYRPVYPPALYRSVFDYGRFESRQLPRVALDVGCGTGQVAKDLAPHFSKVIGVDPSASMIQAAVRAENIEYIRGDAEQLPSSIAARSIDLLACAQAAHWFKLDRFFAEARRVLKPHGVLAIWSYALAILPNDAANEALRKFHFETLKGHWEPERYIVTDRYVGFIDQLPFEDPRKEELEMVLEMNVNDFISYVDTWSGVKTLRDRSPGKDVLASFGNELVSIFGGAQTPLRVCFPLTLFLGRNNNNNTK